jgi:hypothetical protein
VKHPVIAVLAIVLLPAPAWADINIIDNDETHKVDCAKDKAVNIVGNGAKVTLVGTCSNVSISGNTATVTGSAIKVMVSGNENTLALDAVDSILASGNDNKLSWKKTVTTNLKAPKVLNSGDRNKIARTK